MKKIVTLLLAGVLCVACNDGGPNESGKGNPTAGQGGQGSGLQQDELESGEMAFTAYGVNTKLMPNPYLMESPSREKVVLINSHEELAELYQGDEFSGVDFSVQSMLMMGSRVDKGGINPVSLERLSAGEYVLHAEKSMIAPQVPHPVVVALVTEKIESGSTLTLSMTYAKQEETSEVPFTVCFVYEFTSIRDTYPGKVTVINTPEEFDALLSALENDLLPGEFPEVDFATQSLLLACDWATNGVGHINVSKLLRYNENKYVLKTNVTLNDTMIAPVWAAGIVTDKIGSQAEVELDVYYGNGFQPM
jgi:hypothetical protein